jgi:hypothetical protein
VNGEIRTSLSAFSTVYVEERLVCLADSWQPRRQTQSVLAFVLVAVKRLYIQPTQPSSRANSKLRIQVCDDTGADLELVT